jgi:peptide/nickel transport system permease protein
VQTRRLAAAYSPFLSATGPALAGTVVGVLIVELFFDIPGIGSETVSSALRRDYQVVQDTVLLFAVAMVILKMVTEVAYNIADPRIRSA